METLASGASFWYPRSMALWPLNAARKTDAVRASMNTEAEVYHLRTGRHLADYYPAMNLDVPVTVAEAYTVPALARGMDLLTTTLASFPLERVTDGVPGPVEWLTQPEPGRPRWNTMVDTARDLLMEGVAYWHVTSRDTAGYPTTVDYLAPDRVAVIKERNEVIATVDGVVVPLRNLIGFEGWHNGIRNHGARTIRTAISLETAAKRYADVPLPLTILSNSSTYELADDEVTALLNGWKKARQASSVAYTNAGIDAKPMGWNSAETQLVEARQYTTSQIANLVGVPSYLIAGAANVGSGQLTYANVSQEARAFLDYGVGPLVRCVENRLSMDDITRPGISVRFALDQRLRGNPLERAELYEKLISIGVLTVEEARQWEDLAPEGNA